MAECVISFAVCFLCCCVQYHLVAMNSSVSTCPREQYCVSLFDIHVLIMSNFELKVHKQGKKHLREFKLGPGTTFLTYMYYTKNYVRLGCSFDFGLII